MPDEKELVHLIIDGKEIAVPKGTTVFKAAQKLGIPVPVFCYQDRMPPFGACRVCLVEVAKMGKLQTSCTLVATEGMVVNTQTELAVKGRESILEFLLINHPLDCPICDRGGECPLQEHTLNHGPGISRFFEEKRRFKKPLPLGPTLMLDRERCIICARCTRFGDLVAGDHALEFIERGYKSEVGTPDGEPVKSKFIGNTIMICPVGALTSEVYRFRARPWDNEPTNSTCTLCPVGCSFVFDSRDGEIMRTRARENPDVNDIWLCDKGWFGYEFVDHPDRLKSPQIRKEGKLVESTWEEALSLIADNILKFKPNQKLAALGGNPLTVEENYLFQKLMREGAGVNHIDHRIGEPIIPKDKEGIPPGMEISIGDSEKLSFICLFGLDLTEEFPVIWLRLKLAMNQGAKVFFFGHFAPEIARHLTKVVLHPPGSEKEILKEHSKEIQDLSQKGSSTFFVGRQYLKSPYRKAILSDLLAFQGCSLNLFEGQGNSMGARFAGMHPDFGPFGERLEHPGKNTIEILETSAKEGWDFLYVAGGNPAKKYPEGLWKKARESLKFLVVQDLFLTETAKEADVVLPALSYAEKGGTFINIEGRIQTLLPGKSIPENIYSDGYIFSQILTKLNLQPSVEELLAYLNCTRLKPAPREVSEIMDEVFVEREGALFATFAKSLFDQGVRMKHDSHLIQMAKTPKLKIHPEEAAKREIENGETVRVKSSEGYVMLKVKLDEGVAKKTVVIPMGFDDIPVHELGTNLMNGMEIEIEKV